MAIMISASSIGLDDIVNASDLAKSLAPLYGNYATYFLGIGLFAAGITSAITAPLAAAYVAKGCLGFKGNLKSKWFRLVWIIILFTRCIIFIYRNKTYRNHKVCTSCEWNFIANYCRNSIVDYE